MFWLGKCMQEVLKLGAQMLITFLILSQLTQKVMLSWMRPLQNDMSQLIRFWHLLHMVNVLKFRTLLFLFLNIFAVYHGWKAQNAYLNSKQGRA